MFEHLMEDNLKEAHLRISQLTSEVADKDVVLNRIRYLIQHQVKILEEILKAIR